MQVPSEISKNYTIEKSLSALIGVKSLLTDPLHMKEYLAGNIFLPFVNNNNNSKFADKQSKLRCSLRQEQTICDESKIT